MTDPEDARRVEIKDGDQTVAAAEVSQRPGGTTRASLHAAPGHVAPGRRADLVDAVVDLPEVQASSRLEATIPLGDGESLDRLRERTEETTSRPGPPRWWTAACRATRISATKTRLISPAVRTLAGLARTGTHRERNPG